MTFMTLFLLANTLDDVQTPRGSDNAASRHRSVAVTNNARCMRRHGRQTRVAARVDSTAQPSARHARLHFCTT
eukprot:1570710-Amphidinium_carterae.2